MVSYDTLLYIKEIRIVGYSVSLSGEMTTASGLYCAGLTTTAMVGSAEQLAGQERLCSYAFLVSATQGRCRDYALPCCCRRFVTPAESPCQPRVPTQSARATPHGGLQALPWVRMRRVTHGASHCCLSQYW
jgi:hypothetical protein